MLRVRRASCKRPASGAAHAEIYILLLATWPLVGAASLPQQPTLEDVSEQGAEEGIGPKRG